MSDSSEIWFGMCRSGLVSHLRRLANDIESLDGSGPDFGDMVVIDSWSLAERPVPCLVGGLLGHPTIADRKTARTSELFYFDPEQGLARSFSRWYRLGTPDRPAHWH